MAAHPVSAAGVVSFNYDVNGGVPSGATDTAGVVDAAFWNSSFALDGNAGGGNSTYSDLNDDSGNPTTLDITTSTAFLFSIGGAPGQDADGTWNKSMLNGYLNSGSTSSPAVSSFTVAEIPYARYHIYVYFGADDASRTGTVSDGTTTYDFNVLDNMVAGANALFAQTTSTGGAQPEANYAVFSDLTGSSQTITADVPAFGGLSGIQIVEVPEPSAALLGGLGILGLLRRRRA